MNVHLAVPDLFWPAGAPPAPAPRLPALETLVARGRRSRGDAASLEAWLLARWKVPDAPTAPLAAAADGLRPDDRFWLHADPCHFRLGREHVVPLDATLFELAPEESEALVAALNAHFAERGLTFHAAQAERWYLESAAPIDVDARPLAAARSRPIVAVAGRGDAAGHALMNEIQMVLHMHPVNEARESRGDLPVNAVWLWGGGTLQAPTSSPFRRVRTGNPLAAGLALAAGSAVHALPDGAAQWLRAAPREGVELIVLEALAAPAAYGDADHWRERLEEIERAWFAPLLDALRVGRVGMVTLHAIGAGGTLAAETTRQDLRYFWRRPRPVSTYAPA